VEFGIKVLCRFSENERKPFNNYKISPQRLQTLPHLAAKK